MYQKIEHYDISDIVSINKPKKDNLYNKSDAIILSSYYEGFPNVLLEAMKFGKVILISKQAEQNNIIKDGCNGFLFDAKTSPPNIPHDATGVCVCVRPHRRGGHAT